MTDHSPREYAAEPAPAPVQPAAPAPTGTPPSAAADAGKRANPWPLDIPALARELAGKPYVDPQAQFPSFLSSLTYEQYQAITPRPESVLWVDGLTPVAIEPVHPGFIYNRMVKINLVENGTATPLVFSPDQFSYADAGLATQMRSAAAADYAGFTVRLQRKADHPDNPRLSQDLALFLGAAYFQASGKHSRFGLSARAVTIDTAIQDSEEFPLFREFWVLKPAPAAGESITVLALLDSPSLTGAYRFDVVPGLSTVMDVRAVLFRRPDSKGRKFGPAPASSMFLHGEMTPGANGDYRPEVHNSDGVLFHHDAGGWSWTPLWNPERLNVLSYPMTNPRGFGLMQRDNNFDHYQDIAARFDQRPSLWIEPKGDWGTGRLELVEIPGTEDYQGNIVLHWIGDGDFDTSGGGKPAAPPTPAPTPAPAAAPALPNENPKTRPAPAATSGAVPAAGAPTATDPAPPAASAGGASPTGGKEIAYRLYWMDPGATPHQLGRAVATRLERPPNADTAELFVDFEGEHINNLSADTGLTSIVGIPDHVQLLEKTLVKNPATGGWRLGIKFRPPKKGVVESLLPLQNNPLRLRFTALLKRGENIPEPLTETWMFDFTP